MVDLAMENWRFTGKKGFFTINEKWNPGDCIYIYTHTHTNKLGYDLEKTKHTNKAIRLSDLAFWIRCLSRWNRSFLSRWFVGGSSTIWGNQWFWMNQLGNTILLNLRLLENWIPLLDCD
jgi:hypothetical protein